MEPSKKYYVDNKKVLKSAAYAALRSVNIQTNHPQFKKLFDKLITFCWRVMFLLSKTSWKKKHDNKNSFIFKLAIILVKSAIAGKISYDTLKEYFNLVKDPKDADKNKTKVQGQLIEIRQVITDPSLIRRRINFDL